MEVNGWSPPQVLRRYGTRTQRTYDRIMEASSQVTHPQGAEVIDLGDRTLLPALMDAHTHLFLHPGAEDLQTVQESVPQRTIMATLAARDDLIRGTGTSNAKGQSRRVPDLRQGGRECGSSVAVHRITGPVSVA